MEGAMLQQYRSERMQQYRSERIVKIRGCVNKIVGAMPQ